MGVPPFSPSPGVQLTKQGQIALENQRARALQPFRAALANASSASANIIFLGDSVTEGGQVNTVAARWQAEVIAGLRKQYQPFGVVGGAGYIPPFYVSQLQGGVFPAAATVSGSPAFNSQFGFGQRCYQLTGAQTVTWLVTGTSIDVVYPIGSSAGVLGVSVDGGGVSSINEFNASVIDAQVTRITFSTRGSHSVVVSSVSGTAYIDGLMVYDQDESSGIRGWDAGHWGITSSGWNTTPLTNQATLAAPALVVISLGLNDWTSDITPANFKSNLNSIISTISNGYSKTTFVLQSFYQRNTSGRVYTWEQMVNTMYDIAAINSAVIVHDLSRKMPPIATDTLGLYYDTVHPNAIGHRFIADELLDFLIGSSSSNNLRILPSTSSTPSLNIPSGTAPTSPADGDIWYDGANLKIRIGGVTKTVTVT